MLAILRRRNDSAVKHSMQKMFVSCRYKAMNNICLVNRIDVDVIWLVMAELISCSDRSAFEHDQRQLQLARTRNNQSNALNFFMFHGARFDLIRLD